MARRRSRRSVLVIGLGAVGAALLAGCLLTASLDGLTGGEIDASAEGDGGDSDALQPDAPQQQDAGGSDVATARDVQQTADAPTHPTDAGGDGSDAGCIPVTTGLIAHYPMTAATILGTVLVDVSGNGQDGELFGFPSPPTVDAGPLGQALGFGDAGTAYVSVPTLPLDPTTGDSNSFSLWYYRTSQSLDDVLIFAPSSPRYDIWLVNESLCFNNGSGNCWGLGGPSLFDRWVHLVAIFANGTMSASTLYVDGQLASPACLGADVDGSCDVQVTAAPPVTFGGTPADGYVFGGMLSDVRVYTRALTAAEVKAIYDGTACP